MNLIGEMISNIVELLIIILTNSILNSWRILKILILALIIPLNALLMNAILTVFQLMVSTTQLTIVLLLITVVFAVLIIGAIIKMYKLKAENKRLTETDDHKLEVEKSYQDFTEGHLYDNN